MCDSCSSDFTSGIQPFVSGIDIGISDGHLRMSFQGRPPLPPAKYSSAKLSLIRLRNCTASDGFGSRKAPSASRRGAGHAPAAPPPPATAVPPAGAARAAKPGRRSALVARSAAGPPGGSGVSGASPALPEAGTGGGGGRGRAAPGPVPG